MIFSIISRNIMYGRSRELLTRYKITVIHDLNSVNSRKHIHLQLRHNSDVVNKDNVIVSINWKDVYISVWLLQAWWPSEFTEMINGANLIVSKNVLWFLVTHHDLLYRFRDSGHILLDGFPKRWTCQPGKQPNFAS